jgi:hypothetical protein
VAGLYNAPSPESTTEYGRRWTIKANYNMLKCAGSKPYWVLFLYQCLANDSVTISSFIHLRQSMEIGGAIDPQQIGVIISNEH